MKADDRARTTRILARYCQSFFTSTLREYLGEMCLYPKPLIEVVDFDHNTIVELDKTLVLTFVANYLERLSEEQAHER